MRRTLKDIALALQFLTRVPVRLAGLDPVDLPRATAWFPLIGLLIGGAAAILYQWLIPHLMRPLCALTVVLFLILFTGGLHEDALADCADAFGGGWTREDRLRILKDSRIGSFGAIALIFSLGARTVLLTVLPAGRLTAYLISAHVLSRWTVLPLSASLASARGPEGQGWRIAGKTRGAAIAMGTVIAAAVVCYVLRAAAWRSLSAALLVTLGSGIYYKRRIGGITGDCIGATIQLTEIAVYFCGAWNK